MKNTVSQTIELSVVVPAFNEEEGIALFADATTKVLDSLTSSWEIIFVDDGSRDGTYDELCKLRESDPRIKVLRFSRNFGHQIAISAGLEFAQGNAVIVMDSDMQHPPELIPEMIRLWKEGNHVVYTVRTYNKETSWFKRKSSDWFYALCNHLTDVPLVAGAADFRLMDRKAVDCLNAMPEKSRFVRGMIRWLGFRQAELQFTANARAAGTSKYTFRKMFSFAADGITSFSTKPLRWISYAGFLSAFSAVPYTVWAIIYFFTAEENRFTHGWSSLIVAISFFCGLILISLGVIGEYVGKIYMETKCRPLFILQEKHGFETESEHGRDSVILHAEFPRDAAVSRHPEDVANIGNPADAA